MTRAERDELVRLATLIDTEGCIGIYKKRSSSGICWAFIINITQSEKPKFDVLTWMKEKQRQHGGSLCCRHNGGERKPSYTLQWSGRPAVRLARSIQAYLELKKEQCETFLQVDKDWPRGNFWAGRPEDITSRRDKLAALVNSYNAQRETKPSRASDAVDAADDGEGVTTMHGQAELVSA